MTPCSLICSYCTINAKPCIRTCCTFIVNDASTINQESRIDKHNYIKGKFIGEY